jgi:hypothetical protein
MDLNAISLEWFCLGLFIVTFIAIAIIEGPDRFWLPCISIWIFLFLTFLMGNTFNDNVVNYEQVLIEEGLKKPEVVEKGETIALQEAKEKKQSFSKRMMHLLGFHSFVSLFWLAIGYKTTQLKLYRTAIVTFSVFCVVYLLLVWL